MVRRTACSKYAVCTIYAIRLFGGWNFGLSIKDLQCSGTSKSEQSFQTRVRITCPHVPFEDE